MQEEKKAFGCGAGVSSSQEQVESQALFAPEVKKERSTSMVRIGKPAPDFEVPAYYKGEFTNVKLSDYKGKWVLLCFYPGDFTFV